MKYRTSIIVDDSVVEQLKSVGFTLSGFTQTAVDIFLSSGMDDFTYALKLKMIEHDIKEIDAELMNLETQRDYLTRQRDRSLAMYDVVMKNFEETKINTRMCALVDKLNTNIIINGYDKDAVQKECADVLEELYITNPGFDLEKHIGRIKKFLN